MDDNSEMTVESYEKVNSRIKYLMDLILEGLEWEYLNAENFFDVSNLLIDYFLQEEPAATATNIKNNPLAVEEFRKYCAYLALDGISFAIRDLQTNKIVACAFNKFLTLKDVENDEHFNDVFGRKFLTQPESKALIVDFNAKAERTNIFKRFGIVCSIEQVMWVIHPDYRNRKLSYPLNHITAKIVVTLDEEPASIFNIEDLGPDYAKLKSGEVTKNRAQAIHSFCTSEITQEFCKKSGGVLVDTVPFSEIYYKGKNFEELLGKKNASSMSFVSLRTNWVKMYDLVISMVNDMMMNKLLNKL